MAMAKTNRPAWDERGAVYGKSCGRSNSLLPPTGGADAGAAGRGDRRLRCGGEQVGAGSFPKLKIPHQSHADFCSTDTAGGLDNKKRRYAPRGGVAYRLFLWGFPKGATPPFGTRLCEAKCSVLYLLAWLTGKTWCGDLCAPFAPAGKQTEFLRMGMSEKSGCFQRTAAGI